jgi:molybdenum cofactor synthesis domain-containing protein
LTLSDKGSQGQRVDESGPAVAEMLEGVGTVTHVAILPDDMAAIASLLTDWADREHLDLIVTTGGTGLTPRDVTPQATLQVLDYQVPGMAEAMRMQGLARTPHAMLSRALVGVRLRTLIINLPGSPKAARENLSVVLPALPHALAKLAGDPNDCVNP